MAGCCEHGNELPCSFKCGEFLDSEELCRLSRRTLLRGVGWLVG